MGISRLPRNHDERHVAPDTLVDQVVMYRPQRQENRDGGKGGIGLAIREHDNGCSELHRLRSFDTDLVDPSFDASGAFGGFPRHRNPMGEKPVVA